MTNALNWTCTTHPTGTRTWHAGDYMIETTGSSHVIGYSGGGYARRHTQSGGYQPSRGRTGLGKYGTLAEAKARCERDAIA